jgi:Uma2 family endonuclease
MAATSLLEPIVAPAPPGPDLLDDDYELVNGRRIEAPPMSAYAAMIATRLASELNSCARPLKLGEAIVESVFLLPLTRDSTRQRKPDVAFVSSQRWPVGRPLPIDDNAWDVVPDLTIEVISPYNLAEELLDKIFDYFQAGVRLVWVVFPRHRLVYVYDAPEKVRVIIAPDTLAGGDVLPGFHLPLDQLFDPIAPAAQST